MAEFKLGRIRFVWKGEWTSGETYLVDDVIASGGKSYICVINHTASPLFETDLGVVPSKWNIVADGVSWRGDWAPNTYYNPGGLVKYGALIYLCNSSHTSATFAAPDYLGLESDLAKWDIFATSFNWTGSWAYDFRYRQNDFVTYGGTTYLCNTPHVSASALGNIQVTGASGTGTFVTLAYATQVIPPFKIGDEITVTDVEPVAYNGTYTVTACTVNSVTFASTEIATYVDAGIITGPSKLGLEKDQAKWDTVNQGISYLGEWTNAGGVRYKINDIVKYGANLWICIAPHISTDNWLVDQTRWDNFLSGFEYENSWSITEEYQLGDTVTYGGYSYIAKTNHIGSVPTTSPDDWDVFTTGFNFRGDYNILTSYRVGDVVRYGAYTYVATADSDGEDILDDDFWSRLNYGIKWTNNATTYTGIAGINVFGSGTLATFDVVRSNSVYTVIINTGGSGYANGNSIRIPGTSVGGISPANDLVVTVTGSDAGSITEVSSTGVAVTWKSGITYISGDVALFGATSFICVQEHIASNLNRPDADITGTYWNILSSGSEAAILTTDGDLLFYGANGPTRLPIGGDGQLLRVSNGFPSWAYYGVVNNIVYVAPEGVDTLSDGQGLTIDKPWRSVRFACDQVNKGYQYPNTTGLLARNKQFLIKEVTNWINYTYSVTIASTDSGSDAFTCGSTEYLYVGMPFEFKGTVFGGVSVGTTYYIKQVLTSTTFTVSTVPAGAVFELSSAVGSMIGTLSYDQSTSENNTNAVIDAVSYDVTHGGTEEITAVTKSYYTTDGTGYNIQYISPSYGAQVVQTTAAYSFLNDLLLDVLSNTAPPVSYQSLNNVVDEAEQFIDVTAIVANDVPGIVNSLMDILVDGISAGTVSAVRTAIIGQATVSVKTGTYYETLPIIIPKNTAIVGDELRSSVISPTYAVPLLANDKPKSITALERVKVVAADIVQSIAVTPTVGNLETQQLGTAGDVGSLAAVNSVIANTSVIYDIVNSGLGGVPVEILTNPTGFDVGFLNARNQILNNYAFIKADVSAFISINYPAVWAALGASGQATCQRDIGYILDAIRYDLTYGGNTQSLIAGRSYYSYLMLVIDMSEKTATVAAYTHLKSIIDNIILKTALTPQAGNTTPQNTSGTAGSAAAATFAENRVQDVIDWVDDGVSPVQIEPSTAWVSADKLAAWTELQARRAEIIADGTAWVRKFHQYLNFNETTCARDIGYMLDALGYDFAFGSNFASIKAGMSYTRALDSVGVVVGVQKPAQLGMINFLKYKVKSVIATGGVAQISSAIDDIVGFIRGGAVPRLGWTDPAGIAPGFATARTLIWDNKEFIKAEVIEYITDNYPSIEYNQELCARDVGYIVDALRYDLTYGGNSQSVEAAESYYSQLTNALQIDSADKAATLAAYGYLKTLVQSIAVNTAVTPLQTSVNQIVGYSGGTVASQTAVGLLMDNIIAIIDDIDALGTTVTITYPTTSGILATVLAVQTALNNAKVAIQASVIDFIGVNYPNLVYDEVTCARDVGYVIDALGWDYILNSNVWSVKAGMSYYRAQASVVLASQKSATLAAFRHLKQQAVATVVLDSAAVTSVKQNMNIIINILDKGIGETPEYNGTNTYRNSLGTFRAIELLRENKEFIAAESSAWIKDYYSAEVTSASTTEFTTSASHRLSVGDPVEFVGTVFGGVAGNVIYFVATTPNTTTFSITDTQGSTIPTGLNSGTGTMTVRYAFNESACNRDTREYIDSLIYDLQYPGNYKSLDSAQIYLNAVNGSRLSDMFRCRNGTGLRNCTVVGLEGELSEVNDFDTQRPTAGAYVALDPGFGPNDFKSWITRRSHYSQNVSLFGTGCSGAKIDSSLHAGGNKSMVKNDFTTIISDGIGVWCTGSGSLTELVSVFNYYGYAGYLAEFGGRVRATNGNSSYGTYGVIAEGTDTYEQPINGTVDNRAFQASISNTLTDGANEVLALEFSNAGIGYSNVGYLISGTGFGATAVGDEFRDGAVFESRLIDPNTGDGVGGDDYQTAANVAQSGTIGVITIANTDTSLSGVYVGMRIQLTAGTGAGQYANIISFNNGTKEALIVKDSFTPLTITTTVDTGDWINTTAIGQQTLYLNMPIYFTGTTVGGVVANTLYFVKAFNGTTQFSISETAEGATVPLTSSSSGNMILYAAGWDHVVQGKTVTNVLDLTSGYSIEPRLFYSEPGYTSIARTVTSAAWQDIAYGDGRFVGVANGSNASTVSVDGLTWQSAGNLVDTTQKSVVFGGGQGAVAYAVVGGLGGQGAVFEAVLGVPNTTGAATADQVASVRIINGGQGYTTPPVIIFTAVAGGSGARATCTVLNGAVAAVTVVIPGSGYSVPPTVTADTGRITDIVLTNWGRNYSASTLPTITISGGGYSSIATAVPTVDTQTGGILNIRLVDENAVLEDAVGYLGYAGAGYTSTPEVIITDSTARFISISGSTTTSCFQSPAGLGTNWVAGGALPSSNFTSIAYGVTSGTGIYVAVGGSNSGATTSIGTSWLTRTLPTLGSGTYVDVRFTAGKFVALGSNGQTAVSSNNGTTWLAGGTIPGAITTWSSMAYGNGILVAVATGQRTVATSTDFGASWTTSVTPGSLNAGLPAALTWTKIEYGQGLFVAIASGTNRCATSVEGQSWTERAMSANTTWNALAFGNPNYVPGFVALASGNTNASIIRTGARARARAKVADNIITEIRMLEPGSGYPRGAVTATTTSSNLITVNQTTNLIANQPIEFSNSVSGIVAGRTYYIISGSISATQFKITETQGTSVEVTLDTVTGINNITYQAGPILTQTDPSKTKTAAVRVRIGDGTLANPSFTNRGSENSTASTTAAGDGRADLFQPGSYINVAGLFEIPLPGANIQFGSIPGKYFKLVAVTNILGADGNKTAQFQINPDMTVLEAPANGDFVTTTIKYSQVRLTGHDFLYIGTGNFERTNYPNVNISLAIQDNQTKATAGGRVFFTSTDQDGNFNVGGLFGVQQATGTATLNASAFNLSGLQSLQLGSVAIGIGSAIITQFSTDPFFTADSDSVVPTQRAIRAYITSQIGGGASSLNVNTLTSGVVFIAGNQITTTTGVQINVNAKMNFTGGIDGAPVALGFFLQR